MRPHQRIRKTVKWGGVVVCAALSCVWIGSGWYGTRFLVGARWELEVECGRVSIAEPTPRLSFIPDGRPQRRYGALNANATAVEFGPEPFELRWDFDTIRWTSTWWGRGLHTKRYIPLWPAVAIFGSTACVAWHLDTLARRRAKIGFCTKCSYSRTGLAPSAVCPECGAAAESATDQHG